MANRQHFSQRHPFIFGILMIALAMVLILGAMAFFHFFVFGSSEGKGLSSLSGDRIGVVHLKGVIQSSQKVVNWVEELEKDENVLGVIVRINSPGGSVAPSQEIYSALKRLDMIKPVFISMGSVAASGGYYAACGGRRIWANPGSLTASIGVKAQLPDLQKLMEKIGIRQEVITSGKLKNAGSPFRPLNKEERAYFQAMVDDLQQQFLEDVSSSRDISLDKLKSIADGRAMTGRQAFKHRLVDELGTFQDAVAAMRHEVGKQDAVLDEGPKEKVNYIEKFIKSSIDHLVSTMLVKLQVQTI